MHARPLRAAFAVASAVIVSSLLTTVVTAAPAGAWELPRHSSRTERTRCDRTAYVVGDSRRTLEYKVLPKTTDLIWEHQLGIEGGAEVAGMRHVRYLAEPGVVHERFAAELTALMATCARGERPLVFDFMGTNYSVLNPTRTADPAFYDEIEATIRAFYRSAAPDARVVLAELTLDRSSTDPVIADSVTRYLDGYNGALRDLAASDRTHFFFLPAPAIYTDGVVWRDLSHESAATPLAEYLTGTYPADLDRAGVAIVDAADGNTCALLDDPRFDATAYSEGATLGAYLQDFHASKSARRWLDGSQSRPDSRIRLARHTDTCAS